MHNKLELFINNNKDVYDSIKEVIEKTVPTLVNNKSYYCLSGVEAHERNTLHLKKILREQEKYNLLGFFSIHNNRYNYESFNDYTVSYHYKDIVINYAVFYEENTFDVDFYNVIIEKNDLNNDFSYNHALHENHCNLNFKDKEQINMCSLIFALTTLDLVIGRKTVMKHWNEYLESCFKSKDLPVPAIMQSAIFYKDECFEDFENFIFRSKEIPLEISNSLLLLNDAEPIDFKANECFTVDINSLKIK